MCCTVEWGTALWPLFLYSCLTKKMWKGCYWTTINQGIYVVPRKCPLGQCHNGEEHETKGLGCGHTVTLVCCNTFKVLKGRKKWSHFGPWWTNSMLCRSKSNQQTYHHKGQRSPAPPAFDLCRSQLRVRQMVLSIHNWSWESHPTWIFKIQDMQTLCYIYHDCIRL